MIQCQFSCVINLAELVQTFWEFILFFFFLVGAGKFYFLPFLQEVAMKTIPFKPVEK